MFDMDKIEDITHELMQADTKLRKGVKLPDNMDNPASVISGLASLARAASSAAQSLAILMSNERYRELLEARLRSEVSDETRPS